MNEHAEVEKQARVLVAEAQEESRVLVESLDDRVKLNLLEKATKKEGSVVEKETKKECKPTDPLSSRDHVVRMVLSVGTPLILWIFCGPMTGIMSAVLFIVSNQIIGEYYRHLQNVLRKDREAEETAIRKETLACLKKIAKQFRADEEW